MEFGVESFVTDSEGKRVGIILPIEEYNRIMEELEDLEDIRTLDEARANPSEKIPWEEVKAEIEKKWQ